MITIGYDMYISGTIEGEDEAVEAARQRYTEAVEARDALPMEFRGSVLTPEHEALDEESKKVLYAALQARMDEFLEKGGDFFVARLLAQEIPPTEDYIKAFRVVEEAQEAAYNARLSYFRLNIWGMGECRDAMWTLSMAKDTIREDQYDWPTNPFDDDKGEAISEALDSRDTPADISLLRGALLEARGHDWWTEAYGTLTFSDEDLERYMEFQRAGDAHRAINGDPDVPGIEMIKFSSNDGWLVTEHECRSAVEVWQGTNPELRAEVRAKFSWWESWVEFIERAGNHGGFRVY